MLSSGQGQLRHAGIYAMLQWLAGGQVCLSVPLDDVSWRKNVLNVPALFCFQEFPSSCKSLVFNFADQAACFRRQASIFQL